MTVYLKPYPEYYFTRGVVVQDKCGLLSFLAASMMLMTVSGYRSGKGEEESALAWKAVVMGLW
jgi:acyl-coenzyme A synthetase/AMP-(fatty) acid ligase